MYTYLVFIPLFSVQWHPWLESQQLSQGGPRGQTHFGTDGVPFVLQPARSRTHGPDKVVPPRWGKPRKPWENVGLMGFRADLW